MIKKFFGPTWKLALLKIILGIVLFFIVTFIQVISWGKVDYYPQGYPLTFSWAAGPCPLGMICHGFSLLKLIADILIWYLIMCLIIFLFQLRKR